MKPSRIEKAARKVSVEWLEGNWAGTELELCLTQLFVRFAQAERRKAFREAAKLVYSFDGFESTHLSNMVLSLAKREGKK